MLEAIPGKKSHRPYHYQTLSWKVSETFQKLPLQSNKNKRTEKTLSNAVCDEYKRIQKIMRCKSTKIQVCFQGIYGEEGESSLEKFWTQQFRCCYQSLACMSKEQSTKLYGIERKAPILGATLWRTKITQVRLALIK